MSSLLGNSDQGEYSGLSSSGFESPDTLAASHIDWVVTRPRVDQTDRTLNTQMAR